MTTAQNANAVLYAQRRATLARALGADGMAVVPTAPEYSRNRDSTFPHRHDSYFYYLTGFTEPDAVLVVEGATQGTGKTTLFCLPKDLKREQWDGFRLGADAAPETLGVDAAYPLSELDSRMPQLLACRDTVWWTQRIYPAFDTKMRTWLATIEGKARQDYIPPQKLGNASALLDEMRLIKDAHELDTMREAARISAQAHIHAMQTSAHKLRAGEELREYHLDAELLYHFRKNGSEFPAYTSIVAGGGNACILHYRAGDTVIRDGDLVLIDAGCELRGYASDITRTFPANGRFTAEQRAVYDIVLAAQEAAIACTTTTHRFDDPHHAAVRVLTQGLFDLKALNHDAHGSVDDAIKDKAYTPYYMHRTGHWLGMDVHDCGRYAKATTNLSAQREQLETGSGTPQSTTSRQLQASMVLTIEPGLYFLPSTDAPESLHHIGIRIEDDAVVHADAQQCELITRDVPVNADEIENLMWS